jgi:sodium/bile acid cotransporter 7
MKNILSSNNLTSIKSSIYIFLAFFISCQAEMTEAEYHGKIKGYKQKFNKIAWIDVNNLELAKVILVDVREPEEQDVSVIPGSITQIEFENKILTTDSSDFKGKTIVAYCTIGYRSAEWATDMASKGYEVKNLTGGVLAWSHAKKLFSKNGVTTNKVHTYSQSWNFLAKGYVATH